VKAVERIDVIGCERHAYVEGIRRIETAIVYQWHSGDML